MKRYKLYLDGVWYKDDNGNDCYFKYVTSRNSKKFAMQYGTEATITDMHDRIVSKAKLSADGQAYNVCFYN